MAIAIQSRDTLAHLALPIMRRYVDEINETLALFSYRNEKMVFELTEKADHTLRFSLKLGIPYSLHAGVSGITILANIKKAKAEAYYRDFEKNNMCDVSALRQRTDLVNRMKYRAGYSHQYRSLKAVFDFPQ